MKIVLSGSPGIGKTSIIELLKSETPIVPEVWTLCYEQAIANNTKYLFDMRGNLPEFRNELCRKQKMLEKTIKSEITILDRSIIDIVAFAEYYGIPVPKYTYAQFQKTKYSNNVYFCDPLTKEQYKKDICSYEESLKIHQFLRDFYVRCGYKIVNIPYDSVENRLKFLLLHLKLT